MPFATQSHFPNTPSIFGNKTPRNMNSSPKNVLETADVRNKPRKPQFPIHCARISGAKTASKLLPPGSAKKGNSLSQTSISEDRRPISRKAYSTINGMTHHHRAFFVSPVLAETG